MASERFSRQASIVGEEGQSALHKTKAVIVGCGGLGSQVITNLVSAGVGAFILVDGDTVAESNLNRQFIHFGHLGHMKVDSAEEWILRAYPDASVTKHACMLTSGNADDIVAEGDVVIDCLDNIPSRHILAESCRRKGKTLIHGGVEGMYGQVAVFPSDSPVRLESIINGKDSEHASIAPAVSAVGAVMASETVECILGRCRECRLTTLDLSAGRMERRRLSS